MQGSLIEQYNEEKSKHFYNIDFGATEIPKREKGKQFMVGLNVGIVLGGIMVTLMII